MSTANVPPYDVPSVHALQDRMTAAVMSDQELAAIFPGPMNTNLARLTRLAALVATPVPPLVCPRCLFGAVWATDRGTVCTDPSPDSGGAPGCGARWDPCGGPE